MPKLLYINVLMRDESRTKALADYALNLLKDEYEIEEIDLRYIKLLPLDHDTYLVRQNEGEKDPTILNYAKMVKEADKIIIAAPFWDMSFPSILKVFIERVSLYNITFTTSNKGDLIGCCKAQNLLYLTSRGSDINDDSPLDMGYAYIKAVAKLFGIKHTCEVSMKNIDTPLINVNEAIKNAQAKIKVLLKDF